jgi:hypothetical protein
MTSTFGIGRNSVEPPSLRGRLSGLTHDFSLLLFKEGRFSAFDVYDSVGMPEVLKTWVKVLDTQVSGFIVAATSDVAPGVREVSRDYEMAVINAGELGAVANPRWESCGRRRRNISSNVNQPSLPPQSDPRRS